MRDKKEIPIHRMDEKFSGFYMAPLATEKTSGPAYEVSQPHRHDFYYCVLLDEGDMELEVDFKKVPLADKSLFLSYPGQIHQINAARMKRGWFLAFEPSILSEPLKDILDQCLSEIILLPLSEAKCGDLMAFLQHLFLIYEDRAQTFRQTIIQSLLIAFVYQLASAHLSIERLTLIRYSARSIELTKTFKQTLRRHCKEIKRASGYAAKMNITTTYLNDTVRSVTGFPVTYHIQQELMREAQRLLYYSDFTVKEIADTLGFEDEKYFNRLFSKVMGMSPGACRKGSETHLAFVPAKAIL